MGAGLENRLVFPTHHGRTSDLRSVGLLVAYPVWRPDLAVIIRPRI